MDNEMFKMIIENGGIAIPILLAMWTRMEMIARKISANRQDITAIRFELTNVKREQDRQKKDMFFRVGQLNNPR